MRNLAETKAGDTLPCPPPIHVRLHEALDAVLDGHAAGDVAERTALERAFGALLGAHRQLARRDGAR